MKKYYQQIAITLAILMTFMTMSPTLLLASEATGSSTTPTATEENQSGNQETAAALSSDCKVTAKDGAPTLNGTPVFISGTSPETIIIQEQTGSGWTIANLNSIQPEKITLGDAFKDLKVTSVEAVPREKDPTTADQIAIKVEGDVNSDGMVGGQYVPDIYKKGTVQIDKSVLGTASDLNLETDVITPSITLKDLQADGKAVESIPADAKTVTGTLAVDSDVKDAGWFYASKTDGVISNPDSVAYLALGGALGSSTIALGSPSVTGTLKNEIPFTITLDANRSATGDGTITVPAEENCFGSSLSVTIPVATPEKAADTTTPTTNSTPSTTAATPQTTADQNLVTATPQTSLDQNAVVNKLTETVKNTPILSFLGTLTTGSIAVSNVQEYYAGSPVYTITLKAKGDYKFAAKLDAQQFKLQNALSEVTVNSISRVSDTEVRLDVTGNIVNGKNDQDGHQIVSYSDGSIQITKNQISGAAEDVTVSVPVSTPTAVLQNVKVDGSVAKTKDGRVTIDGNAKKISGDFVIEGADGASYWYRNGAAGQKDMCTSLVLGEAFAGATEVKCEVDPVQKNKIHFSFKLGDTEVSAITGTIQVDAKNNSFNQDLTAEMAVNTVSLSCTSLSCENVTDDPMKYTAVIKVNGSISLPITKDIIEFTDGFEACKITDVTYDQKADTITVKFTKARYLDTPAMEGSLKLRATKGQLRYSDGPVFSGVLSVALHDPVNHLKYKEDDPAKTTDTKSYSTMDWYKLSHFATNLLNKTICHIPSFIFSGKKDGDADYAKTHNVLMDVTNFFLGDIGKDLLGILTGWDVKTTTTPGLSNEMQLKAINATAQSNTEVLLGGMEKQTCFSKLQDIDNDINKLNIKDQLFNDAAKDAQIFGNYLNEVSEGKLEEDDEIVTSKDIDNNAQLKTDYQSIYSSDASSIIAYLGQTKTGSKTELLEAMKEFIKNNPVKEENQIHNSLTDYLSISSKILPGKDCIFYNATGSRDSKASGDIFEVYAEYASLAKNYNSQTWDQRQSFNDKMYNYFTKMDMIYANAVYYDQVRATEMMTVLKPYVAELKTEVDNNAAHPDTVTQASRDESIKNYTAISEIYKRLDKVVGYDTSMLNKLKESKDQLKTCYDKAEADITQEKENAKPTTDEKTGKTTPGYVICYKNNQHYSFDIENINGSNTGIKTQSKNIDDYFQKGHSDCKVDSQTNYSHGGGSLTITDKYYGYSGLANMDKEGISTKEYEELKNFARDRVGKISAYKDIWEACVPVLKLQGKSADDITALSNSLEGMLIGKQSNHWETGEYTKSGSFKYSWIKYAISGTYLTAQSQNVPEKIVSADIRWRTQGKVFIENSSILYTTKYECWKAAYWSSGTLNKHKEYDKPSFEQFANNTESTMSQDKQMLFIQKAGTSNTQ